MRITSRQLRQLIREELQRSIYEVDDAQVQTNLSPGQVKAKRFYDEGLLELLYDDGTSSTSLGEFPKVKPELLAAAIKKHPQFDGLNIDLYRVKVPSIEDAGGVKKYFMRPYYPHQHELTKDAVSKIVRVLTDAEKPAYEAAKIVKSTWESYKGKINLNVTQLKNSNPSADYKVKVIYTTKTDGTVSDVKVTSTPPNPDFCETIKNTVSAYKSRPIPVDYTMTVTFTTK